MNLLKKKLIKFKNNNIKVEQKDKFIKITNNTDKHAFLVYPHIFDSKNNNIAIELSGKIIKGNGAILQVIGLKRNILAENSFNACSTCKIYEKKFILAIKIYRQTEVIIEKADFTQNNNEYSELDSIINSENDILIITPSYPTEENKYFGGFIHTRVKAYKEAGIKFDLVCAHQYPNTCSYEFEGINVIRTNFNGLRQILTQKKYKKIILHFFDYNYAKVLDACDLSSTELYLWVHGPETLYWDWPKMTDKYFTQESRLTESQIKLFKDNDKLINRYNNNANVHWIFVSNWIKERSEELINIKFNNYSIIPNYIDENLFTYKEKNIEQRKKIFFIRRFDDINKYAIDVNVRTILELSKKDFFQDLEFNIYGTGEKYDVLINPIKNFPNVHLYQQFLSHEEMAKVHKENGIGLFATRYDAQGVSMCEAAMSGVVIISSINDAIAEFIPNDEGILCDTEYYEKYADEIEKIYKNPNLFNSLSKKCHEKVYDKCNFAETIQKEIEIINKPANIVQTVPFDLSKSSEKILSIIIPSYNTEKYLYHGVYTMLEHSNGNKIEVIIVNDGSKDDTLNVAKKLQERYSNKNIIIINKENGGHGSTINEGLKVATGKYIRIIDSDDWVETSEMNKLINILQTENSDIILTDYSEDRAITNDLIKKHIYDFMIPKKQYKFDDLCYEGYGFYEWGPILATGNFKKEILKDTFTLTEKSLYIDMEFDAYSIQKANTITYYPLNIYRYFIGREGQSISFESYKKNYQQHENVLFNLIKFYTISNISENKKSYILNKLIIPMTIANYTVVIEYLKSRKKYNNFEKRLREYEKIYNNPKIATKMKKMHRKTNGIFIKYDGIIKKLVYKFIKQ